MKRYRVIQAFIHSVALFQVLVVESNFVGARKITQSIVDHNSLFDIVSVYDSCDAIPQNLLSQVIVLDI